MWRLTTSRNCRPRSTPPHWRRPLSCQTARCAAGGSTGGGSPCLLGLCKAAGRPAAPGPDLRMGGAPAMQGLRTAVGGPRAWRTLSRSRAGHHHWQRAVPVPGGAVPALDDGPGERGHPRDHLQQHHEVSRRWMQGRGHWRRTTRARACLCWQPPACPVMVGPHAVPCPPAGATWTSARTCTPTSCCRVGAATTAAEGAGAATAEG